MLCGGELVTARARDMVSGGTGYCSSVAPLIQPPPEKLEHSRFNTPEDMENFAQKFDEGVKRVFSDESRAQFVKFGSPRDNDPKYGIKAGRLSLTGYLLSTLPIRLRSRHRSLAGHKSESFLNPRSSPPWIPSGRTSRKSFP